MRSGKGPQRRERCLESGRSILLHGFCKRGGFRACGRDQRAFRSPFGNLRPHTGWRPCKLRNRKVLLQRYSWNKHAFFGSLNCLGKGDWGLGDGFSIESWFRRSKRNYFRILQQIFPFRGWLRRPGGQGGFRPPPYAPLDPLYPLQTAEGYPRTPLVPPRARPLVSRPTGSVTGTPFGLVLGQQPIGCQGGHALCPAPWPQHVLPQGIPAVTVPCHHSKDRPAPRSRGRDQLRRRRQWPSQGRT